jgi:hypothetical protein
MSDQIIVQQSATTRDPRRRDYAVRRRQGRAGNLQTLRIMATLVRRDVQDLGLRDFAARLVVGVAGHDQQSVAETLFYYVRDKITYRSDPFGYEVIADARKSLSLGYGDCGDKTVLLATLLGGLGIKSRFVVLSYKLPAFQHVYLEARIDHEWRPYDPTPEEAVPGWESRGFLRGTFPIFDGGAKSDRNNLAGLKTAGIGAGMGALQGAPGGPISTAIGAITGFLGGLLGGGGGQTPEMIQTGAQWDQADKALAVSARALAAKESITAAEYQQFISGLSALEQFAVQSQIPYIQKQWQMEQANWSGWPELLRAKVVGGVGGATGSSAAGGVTGQTGSESSASSGPGFGTLLLLGGGGLLVGKILFAKR